MTFSDQKLVTKLVRQESGSMTAKVFNPMKTEPKKKTETQPTRQMLKCVLTEPQLLAAGHALAEATQKLGQIENDKKRVTDDFKAQASKVEADIGILSNKIQTRCEYRDVDCTIHFGDPKEDFKTTYRDDTGEQIACIPLTPEEKQRKLSFDVADKIADKVVEHYEKNPQPGVTVSKVKP